MGEEGWVRLGREVRSERSRKRWSREDLARRSGLSYRLLSDLETARRSNFSPETFTAIEVALRWEDGTCLDITHGGRIRRQMNADLLEIWDGWPSVRPDKQAMVMASFRAARDS